MSLRAFPVILVLGELRLSALLPSSPPAPPLPAIKGLCSHSAFLRVSWIELRMRM